MTEIVWRLVEAYASTATIATEMIMIITNATISVAPASESPRRRAPTARITWLSGCRGA